MKPILSTDRMLKNQVEDSLVEFINDQMHTMNDLQLIRSIYILSNSTKSLDHKIKDRALRLLLQNIHHGKFEFKKGNTLVAFSQMVNHNFINWFRGSKDIKMDIVDKTLLQQCNRAILPVLTFIPHQYIYHDLACIAKHFIPFFKHYFSFYKPSQKLVSLKYLQNF